MPKLIDLLHMGTPGAIAVYLIDLDGPTLVDCGPATCHDALVAGLESHGVPLADLRRILLTHIHPDHAGGAGALVARHPSLDVHVHHVGAPHVVDPSRLLGSARRLYGDEDYDRLFGDILPIPEERVHVLGERIGRLEVIETPGHAWHHVAYLDPDDGSCIAGDAAGVVFQPGRFLYPASAPPEIDVPAWLGAIDRLAARAPASLWISHFGRIEDEPLAHLARLRERLVDWSSRVETGATLDEYAALAEAALRAESPGDDLHDLLLLSPTWAMSYAGVKRYYDKRREREADGA
ncbi:MAG: MBL fold metallo-hydrolase [Thermoleophilia bacterium]